jgi:large subunit ribosomal protein L20
MARVTSAQNKKRSTKKLFKRAKGFFLARKNTRRQANEAVMHARANAFIGRKQRKRAFRQLWIARISAAVKMHDMSYSRFIHGLGKAGVTLNRKMLSELAINDTPAFEALVALAKSNL